MSIKEGGMHLERYELRVENNMYFFFSEGPKGRVEKAILYYKIPEWEVPTFNVAFGDWDERLNRINDKVVTNNGDRQKILATVAASVIHFMSKHPHAYIFATGSTPPRTRLYQMGIRDHLMEIAFKFNIHGFIQGRWEPFKPGRNYDGFLITNKYL